MNEPLVLARAADEVPATRSPLQAQRIASVEAGRGTSLSVTWARHEDQVREAQRLRHRIFASETGARPTPREGTPAGHDADALDGHCEHLLVHAQAAGLPRRLVGTYRVLTPAAARRVGRYDIETEFDLSPLRRLRPYMAELGRVCVDVEYRTEAVILRMWSTLADLMNANGVAAVIGCASVSMADGGHAASRLFRHVSGRHLVPAAERVQARLPLPVHAPVGEDRVEVPALVDVSLRCGARLLGAPGWNPHLDVADLPMLLRLADVPERCRPRFLRG